MLIIALSNYLKMGHLVCRNIDDNHLKEAANPKLKLFMRMQTFTIIAITIITTTTTIIITVTIIIITIIIIIIIIVILLRCMEARTMTTIASPAT